MGEASQKAALPSPLTPAVQALKGRVSAERWERIVVEALGKAEILEGVWEERRQSGNSWRRCLRAVAPEVSWSAYLHWSRRWKAGSGPLWERLVDRRVPPAPRRIPEEIRHSVQAMRRVDPQLSCEEAREHSVAQFGEAGRISNASLRRIWHAAGLNNPPGGGVAQESVEHYSGGGGLALIGAAVLETGVPLGLAQVVLREGERAAREQRPGEVLDTGQGRDEQGRFAPTYNQLIRAGLESGERDPRWAPDAVKRGQRHLQDLSLLGHRVETLGQKLLVMGAIPLITERRGFDGLEGPAGGWLALLGAHPYMPATLDKALAELALLDVGDAMWGKHGEQWKVVTEAWTQQERKWRRWVVYVDATQDPYWTRHFAVSGKVSRVGRVMPCISRLALTAGPGVPLLVETRAGGASLKNDLLEFLDRCEALLGKGELGRLTVVDAEVATARLLTALAAREGKLFITVLKGPFIRGAKYDWSDERTQYRSRDLLREGQAVIKGKGAPEEGLKLRVVEMVREGSRHPTPTVFATNASPEELETTVVPDAYLSRWPHQEQRFRDGRNGGGLNRSHGYGGEFVSHVALETKLEEAKRKVRRAEEQAHAAGERVDAAKNLLESVPKENRGRVRDIVKIAEQQERQARKDKEKKVDRLKNLQQTPREIYTRDTTRESLMTCLKLMVVTLLEYVLKEYFGGLRMEWRNFMEQFVLLPVTVLKTPRKLVFSIQGNPRQPRRMAQLQAACAEITSRGLRQNKRRLIFEVVPPAGGQ